MCMLWNWEEKKIVNVACQLFTSKLGTEFVFQKFMGENFCTQVHILLFC